MNPLPEIADRLIEHYGERLRDAPALAHDALTVTLDNGVVLELRFPSPEEYSIQWRFGAAECRIDTAPLHPELSTFPHHLHDSQGRIHPDPLTIPGRSPWDNIQAVLNAVLENPLAIGG